VSPGRRGPRRARLSPLRLTHQWRSAIELERTLRCYENERDLPTLLGWLQTNDCDVSEFDVVLCPLAHDIPAAERERRETWFDQVKRRIQAGGGDNDVARDLLARVHPHAAQCKALRRLRSRLPEVGADVDNLIATHGR